MKTLIKRILNNSFFRSISTLMSGSIVAQIITIIAAPLMTRLYSEEQIGEYTLILTAVSMFGTVVCARYDQTIVSENDDHKSYALVKLCFILTIIFSILVSIGYTAYYKFTDAISIHFLEIFIWIFILLLFSGIGLILTAYNNRFKQYKLMASTHVLRTTAKEVSLVGFGFLKFGLLGLLISQLLGIFMGLNSQAKSLRENKEKLAQVTEQDIKEVAQLHMKQPLYSVPASFANSFSYSVLNLFISGLFGNVVLAHYSMSFRMLGLPLALISVNVSKAFFEKASREYGKTGQFYKTYLQSSLLLLAVAVPMTVLLILLAPWAFELFFGQGWETAGRYVQILAPMFGIRLIVGSLTPTMTISKKQGLELILQCLFILCSILTYVFQSIDVISFLTCISVLYSIVYIVFYFIMLKISYSQKGE